MQILPILEYPTVIDDHHESLFRCYHILDLVEDLLAKQTPPEVILSIVQELREAERKEVVWGDLMDAGLIPKGYQPGEHYIIPPPRPQE